MSRSDFEISYRRTDRQQLKKNTMTSIKVTILAPRKRPKLPPRIPTRNDSRLRNMIYSIRNMNIIKNTEPFGNVGIVVD